MLIIVPLWLALVILLITRPLYGLKMIFGLILGGAIGLALLTLLVASFG